MSPNPNDKRISVRKSPADESNICVIQNMIIENEGLSKEKVTPSTVIKVALQRVAELGLLKSDIQNIEDRTDAYAIVTNRRERQVQTFIVKNIPIIEEPINEEAKQEEPITVSNGWGAFKK